MYGREGRHCGLLDKKKCGLNRIYWYLIGFIGIKSDFWDFFGFIWVVLGFNRIFFLLYGKIVLLSKNKSGLIRFIWITFVFDIIVYG
jgi:hypothetical protein